MKFLSVICLIVVITMSASNPIAHHSDKTTVIVEPVVYRPQPYSQAHHQPIHPQPIRPQPYYAVQPAPVYQPLAVPVRGHPPTALVYSSITAVGKK